MADITGLTRGILHGEIRAIAKSITAVENNLPEKEDLIRSIFRKTGIARVVGITGAPGSGKSTLADRMIQILRDRGTKVAVIAVDPSSPFSKGAILGDRIRMQRHAADPGVFIRSMASRGHLGGVSSATFDTVKILDAAGYEYIFIETIGVGQTEIEIVNLSDLILLVLIPGMGDEIQALKSGVMEIGDLYVINKKDLDGADRLKAEVEYALNIGVQTVSKHDINRTGKETQSAGEKSVLMVSARDNDGMDQLAAAVEDRFREMESSGYLYIRRKQKTRQELKILIMEKMEKMLISRFGLFPLIDSWTDEVTRRNIDPYTVIEEHIQEIFLTGEEKND